MKRILAITGAAAGIIMGGTVLAYLGLLFVLHGFDPHFLSIDGEPVVLVHHGAGVDWFSPAA